MARMGASAWKRACVTVALATCAAVTAPSAAPAAQFRNFLPKTGFPGISHEAGRFNTPTGIATAPNGVIYVSDSNNHRVQYFTRTGVRLGGWGSYGPQNGRFAYPWGLAVSPDGAVWVTDRWRRVQSFTSNGRFRLKIGDAAAPSSQWADPGRFAGPVDVASSRDGTLYVNDWGNSRIQRFSESGAYLGSWGSSGTADGQFRNARGITVAPNGMIYVADSANNRVQFFDATGTFVGKIEGLAGVTDVAFGPDGHMWVARTGGVSRFATPEGRPLTWRVDGYMLAVGRDGSVYVTDPGEFHGVHVLRPYPEVGKVPATSTVTLRLSGDKVRWTTLGSFRLPTGPMAGSLVELQYRTSSGAWKTYAKAKTNVLGRAVYRVPFTRPGRTTWRWYSPKTSMRESAASAATVVTVR